MKIKTSLFVFHFFIFLIKNTNCAYCGRGSSITSTVCFNNIIYFEQENRNYSAGHFAVNKNGDMIIEYSYNQYRLFYGLKADGNYYFPEIIKEIEITNDTVDSNFTIRYESINSLIIYSCF